MVIAGSWILAFILQLREYGKKVVDNSCVYVWSEEFVNSFSLMWHSFVFVSCIILAGLYSRVVHTLWFRRNDHDDITHNRQVWINRYACRFSCVPRDIMIEFGHVLEYPLVATPPGDKLIEEEGLHFDHEELSAILTKIIMFKINRNGWTRTWLRSIALKRL